VREDRAASSSQRDHASEVRITLARDSLVFGRLHLCTTPLRALLWKKFLTWVKPTQRDTSPASRRILCAKVFCARAPKIEFAECTKTSIP
jgi:hypothetical protein